jgi:hypothetical protein
MKNNFPYSYYFWHFGEILHQKKKQCCPQLYVFIHLLKKEKEKSNTNNNNMTKGEKENVTPKKESPK